MLKFQYATKEEIPQGFEDYFAEKDGKWFLKVEGMPDTGAVTRLTTTLAKVRDELKTAQAEVKAYKTLGSPDEITAAITERDELKIMVEAGDKKPDQAKIDELVEKRVQLKVAPLQRELDTVKSQLSEKEAKIGELSGAMKKTTIVQALTKAANEKKVVPEAVEDLLLHASVFDVTEDGQIVTRDGVGVTPGLDPASWLGEIGAKRPHWFPQSQGGGAKGGGHLPGGGENPWSKNAWNLTEQGKFIRTHGIEKAKEAAKRAGVDVNATKPPEK